MNGTLLANLATSTTTHALIKALLRHDLDLEFDCVCKVCEYMCKEYDHEKRVEEHARREAEDVVEDEESLADHNTYSDEELLEHGVPELTEECEVPALMAR